jgi:diguanylate cyclase (GGDEF)-like protein
VLRNVRRKATQLRSVRPILAWRLSSGGFAAFCLALATAVWAATPPPDFDQQLLKADSERTANFPQFAGVLQSLEQDSERLSQKQRDYLHYLEAWKNAYEGDDETAIARLNTLADEAIDPGLRLRAGSTATNLLEVSKRYTEAFARLSSLLALLPKVSDKAARQQLLMNAAQLYYESGLYPLALSYSQTVIDEDWDGRGVCKGSRVKLYALYQSGSLKTVTPALQSAIDNCVKMGETSNADIIRMTEALVDLDLNKVDDAVQILQGHYNEVKETRNPRLMVRFDEVLAEAYRRKGLPVLARESALKAIAVPVKEFDNQLFIPYRVLYEVAKAQGDFKAALEYQEQYFAVYTANLEDLSARQLAFQKVGHENIANKLQLDALNKENHVLQLQRELSGKAMETSRLYIALLTMTVVFIGLWAYRTKRSQLHFQTLSQLDGLTGICNRPHFIAQAEKILETSRRTGAAHCIILFDLDHFKSINDRHGHATGDFVLKRTVSACRVHLEKGEIFGRFGGEEFAVLLPGCAVEQGRERAEQLRLTISNITAYQGNSKATVSASFGIATTQTSGHGLGQLLAHADAALYAAKRSGRNCVLAHGDQTAEITPLSILTATGDFPPQVSQVSSGRSSTG